MKLVRFGDAGQEQPGLIDSNGAVRDLSDVVKDLTPDTLGIQQLQKLKDIDPQSLPLVPAGVRMGPCVAKPGKFVCIGLNYHDHAVETGLTPPSEPVVFMKAVGAIGMERKFGKAPATHMERELQEWLEAFLKE